MASNNDFITFASVQQHRESLIRMDEILKPHPECCIYRVPKVLRKTNEEAYTPQDVRFPITNRVNRPIEEADIRTDLLLLENQLPFFVLEKLYAIALSSNDPDLLQWNIKKLSLHFFSDDCFSVSEMTNNTFIVFKHFTDLKRITLTKGYPSQQYTGGSPLDTGTGGGGTGLPADIPCAIKLQESGVKFKHVDKAKYLLDMEFGKTTQQDYATIFQWLKVHELKIPSIQVFDETESLLRNLMAFEQCHYPKETHVCNYIYMMDRLIDTKEDVNLLIKKGIVSNYVGDPAQIASMFNKLCTHIVHGDLFPYDAFRKLRDYYDSQWNHATATLKRVYFSNPWRGTGTIAATVLLFLTLVQTVFSILQVLL